MEKPSNPYNLSASTLKALARFGPDNNPYIAPKSKLEPLPLPVTDWELWAHMPKATLAETIAVSLGIDPSATKPGSGYVEPGKEYDRRLKIACAYVSHAGPLKSLDALPPMHMLFGPATATVSLPQFAEWALSMGWALPDKFPRWKVAPAKTVTQTPAPAQSPAPPAPVAMVALKEPAKAGPGWNLKTSIKRAPGYRWPLYLFLKAAHIAGQSCPKPRDVLEAWTLKPPPDVQAMPDGVKYNDGLGNSKEADLKAIQQAIKNLLN